MPQALILSGSGRYADPWHRFDETSAVLATLAKQSGWQPTIIHDIDPALADGLDGIDLLIVNAGDPWRNPDVRPDPTSEAFDQGRANLDQALGRGMSVLSMHCGAASLRDYPQYRQALGGEWRPGLSWHPARADLHIRPLHDQISEGLCDFTVNDERYTDLVIDRDVEPLLTATGDEDEVIIAWANTLGAARVIYDSLGHDTGSYDSCGHKSFLRRALSWLSPRDDVS
jgi:hypothetical protein